MLISLKFVKTQPTKDLDVKQTSPQLRQLIDQLSEYFNGIRKDFAIATELRGTDFQKSVWQKISEVPYGQTVSYRKIAAQLGNPDAARAVGSACNRNPIVLVVPCHRIVGAKGRLVGYAGGLDIKQALLVHEKLNR